jgi:hypothetical protein
MKERFYQGEKMERKNFKIKYLNKSGDECALSVYHLNVTKAREEFISLMNYYKLDFDHIVSIEQEYLGNRTINQDGDVEYQ